MYLAGVEIGGTKIQVVLGTPSGEILQKRSFAVSREAGAAGIQKQILLELTELRKKRRFSAIGVGFGGPIDWKTGRIFKSHHISGWDGFELTNWLASEFKVRVKADNDANVAALAEAKLGAGKGKDPVFYMTIGSGIGGGIIQMGRIYHGHHPGEIEIGHTRIPFPNLPPAQWPILENLCSGWALDEKARSAVKTNPHSHLAGLIQKHGPGKEARFIREACQRGDSDALRIWDDLCVHIALGLSHIIHLFHPQVLIIGGGVAKLGESLITDIRKNLDQMVMKAYEGTCLVTLSHLGEQVVPTGALLLAA